MRRLIPILALLCFAVPAGASITVVGTCNGTTSCSATGGRPGDLAVAWAYRAGSATAPTKPGSMTNVTNGSSATGANRSWRMGCLIVGSTASQSSGTWTNATNMGMLLIRGTGATDTANCASAALGTVGTANSVSSSTATYSALTMSGGSSSLALLVMGSSTSGQTCMPTSGTSKTSVGDINIGIANATGNWAADTCTITSSVTTEIVVEIKAINSIATCSSGCPGVAEYDQWGFTGQNTLVNTTDEYYHLAKAVGTGNTIACEGRYFQTGATALTATAGLSSDLFVGTPTSMTEVVSANNGTTGTVIYGIELFNAGGYQNIHLHWAANVLSRAFECWVIYGVTSGSDPSDGSAANMESSAATFNQAGSITPTAANDIFLVGQFIDGDNVVLNNVTGYYAPYDNWNLEGTNQEGPAGYDVVDGATSAINLGMAGYQSTINIWGTVAMAFKAASAGTAPTGMYIRRDVTDNSTTSSYIKQLPCTGNLQVLGEAVYQITGITADSDSNTWNQIGPATTLRPQQMYSYNYTCTNNNFRTITIANNTPATPLSLHFYDIVGAKSTASPVDTGVTSSTTGATVTGGFVDWSSTNLSQQGAKAAGNTSCTNNPANSITGPLAFTPAASGGGIAIWNEETNEGPDCVGADSGNVFDAGWFAHEEDTAAGSLDSSSGYGHVPYTNTSALSWTSYWANSLATGASAGEMGVVLYEAAPASGASTIPRRRFGVW